MTTCVAVELSACPFCGNSGAAPFVDRAGWRIGCPKCGTVTAWQFSKDTAASAWNCRAVQATINLNARVTVRLTQRGVDVLEAYTDEVAIMMGRMDYEGPKPNSDGSYTFQLWDLAHIFGSDLHIGFEMVFESANLAYEAP